MERIELQPPLITVAVPTCNGALHLPAALTSILRQSSLFHLLIVDDRSDDETLDLAREVAGDRVRIEMNSDRLGLASNWNRCVALSETPLVAIFHQDDLMLPGYLDSHLQAHLADRNLGWVASAAEVIDRAGSRVPETVVDRGGLGDRDQHFGSKEAVGLLMTQNPLRCSAVTISRSAHLAVGGFDPSYRYVVDWDYWVRVAQAFPVAWRAQTLTAIRWHLASETHRFATGTADLDETARLLDRFGGRLDIAFERSSHWRRQADQRLARAWLNRAHAGFKQRNFRLARHALLCSLRLAPRRIVETLAGDPRLLAQMGASLVMAPWTRGSDGGDRLPDPLQ